MPHSSRQNSTRSSVENEDTIEIKPEPSIDEDLVDGFSSTRVTAVKDEDTASIASSASIPLSSRPKPERSESHVKMESGNESDGPLPVGKPNGQASPLKMQPVKTTKAGRSAASKIPPRIAPLFDDLPDVTDEAKSHFVVLKSCTYQNKYLGYTEHSMSCDCSEEWDGTTKQNLACGEDSDCINRATKMECYDDCDCGAACQNQRFTRHLYADVSVIKTEKKGYGLRANTDLKPHSFIYEYIGECIGEAQFRKRMIQYDEEGIKHFYFMSLSKGEFLDATKKGNLGRFCNHSCNPNCYVDKWVVGDKLRMGIFAEKSIKAGEELVFNYNVDRYGANPQPCYCGESNCTGFIGGKTQTERGTKLSTATIEALGIEDADSWDTMVAKKPKKKKSGEDDEDYVDSVQAKALDADSVTKVMAALMQCKEKWIAVKLLKRLQTADDETVGQRVVKLHGYRILNSQLSAWREDENIILQILDILDKLPRLTRNKIVDAKIDQTLQPLSEHADQRVAAQSAALLDDWSKLELAYRIPRKKRDEATPVKNESLHFERRESANERKRSKSRSKSPPTGPSAGSVPSGPRALQQAGLYKPRPPPPTFPRGPASLPKGWFSALDNGKTYYYSASGQTTWTRPTNPADQPPPPPKAPSQQDVLRSIIDNIVQAKDKERETKTSTPDTPEPVKKEKKEDRWKSYDDEKRKKLYENTLFPLISHVMNKYKHKIPRDDLKRFAKEIAKKLVASDFKSGRVQDPTKIDEKQQRKVKEFCKQFFDKAAHKHKLHEEERAARKSKKGDHAVSTASTPTTGTRESVISPDLSTDINEDDEDVKMSEDDTDDESVSPPQIHNHDSPFLAGTTNGGLKRKRGDEDTEESPSFKDSNSTATSPVKKLNFETLTPPPPPPPPPPPSSRFPLSEATPDSTPATPGDDAPMDIETEILSPPASGKDHIHADTSFRNRTMADVLAQAQQQDTDDDDGGGGRGDLEDEAEMDIENDDDEEDDVIEHSKDGGRSGKILDNDTHARRNGDETETRRKLDGSLVDVP